MVTEDSATRQACARLRAAKAAEEQKTLRREQKVAEDAELEKSEAVFYQEMGLDFLF